MSDRRTFFKKVGALGLSGIAIKLVSNEKLNTIERFSKELNKLPAFTLPVLPYGYSALEPFIDRQTMLIHHTKHHQAYVDKLNKAVLATADEFVLEEAFKTISKADSTIRDNGGGHYNHSLFWKLLKPIPVEIGVESVSAYKPIINEPIPNFLTGVSLAAEIDKQFGSFEEFKKQFTEKAIKIFGSGWCWLIEQNGKLKITTTANQDNPLMDVVEEVGKPILALDVWEHAYYLKYQNKRIEYINNWWNIVNWEQAEFNFKK